MRAIVWFRQDLRLADNEALVRACQECEEVIPLFIQDPNPQSVGQLGAASKLWLNTSLQKLTKSLEEKGSKLILKKGKALRVLNEFVDEISATHLYWNRCYEPSIRRRDEEIKSELGSRVVVRSSRGNLNFEPWEILKKDNTPYRVFTPYWKRSLQFGDRPSPLPAPDKINGPEFELGSLKLSDLGLLPTKEPDWYTSLLKVDEVGEKAALRNLHDFLSTTCRTYKEERDYPALRGTSFLSPNLHFGEISPRQILHLAQSFAGKEPSTVSSVTPFLRQIAWREFAYSILYHFPDTLTQPMNKKFERFLWEDDYDTNLEKWKRGLTGIPIVDAGMRELWKTGRMHNRVRMLTASFLTKNLLIPWQEGEAWFRDTLLDADLANNVMGWQWVAGTGVDAAPYFRIFNPHLQSKKFDRDGSYIRRWVPELETLAAKEIHSPASAIATSLGYPLPIVDLKVSRIRALERYKETKM